MSDSATPPCPIAWTVAGSDSGAGAGIQADLRAFDAFGDVHGCTAIAAITAQNSVEVARIEPVDESLLQAQLDSLAHDLKPRAIKTGLLGSAANLRALVRTIDRLREEVDPMLALVVDPVLRASTGKEFANTELLDAYRNELLPRATLITPNRAEAAVLLGRDRIETNAEVEAAARELRALGCNAVAITGGDAGGMHSADYVLTSEASGWLSLPRVETAHNHGTGCVFASSTAAALARGFVAADALVLAKMATTHALRRARAAGAGAGAVRPHAGFACDRANLPALALPLLREHPRGFTALANPDMGLYAIVDSAAWVRRALDAGVRTVQLRIKEGSTARLRDEIRQSVEAARAVDAQLFINDHWEIALEERAYGVHLGQDDLHSADLARIADAGLRLGVSTHSYWEVCRAWAVQPSYIACGPVHATNSKPMPWIAQGNGNLAYWCALLAPTPVVAIAGLDAARAAKAIRCGAAGAAVITAITQAVRPEDAIAAFMRAIESARMPPRRAQPPRIARPTLARRR